MLPCLFADWEEMSCDGWEGKSERSASDEEPSSKDSEVALIPVRLASDRTCRATTCRVPQSRGVGSQEGRRDPIADQLGALAFFLLSSCKIHVDFSVDSIKGPFGSPG